MYKISFFKRYFYFFLLVHETASNFSNSRFFKQLIVRYIIFLVWKDFEGKRYGAVVSWFKNKTILRGGVTLRQNVV